MKIQFKMLVLVLSALALIPAVAAAQPAVHSQVSPNIPLSSYVYNYLEKLDGLGLLKAMPTGTKPYTRMQVAGWLQAIRDELPPERRVPQQYVRTIINQLAVELGTELAAFSGAAPENPGMIRRELRLATSYYDGKPLTQHRTKSSYQPLVINENGYQFTNGLNSTFSPTFEGAIWDALQFSLAPRLGHQGGEAIRFSLESGYLKTHLSNCELQVGKDAFWWGPGERGNLSLTNNATPLTALQIRNLKPIQLAGVFQFMKQADFAVFYADLEDNRDDVNSPAFVGVRTVLTPSPNFTVAGTLNAMVGGEGHEIHGSDLWDFIKGENASNAADDQWNSIAGFDFRWRFPRLNGLQLYGELYGEDQAGTIPLPAKNAYLFGVYLPRLTPEGEWELKLETAKTTAAWYNHSLYTEGYTYHNNIIGDAMGNNAERLYLKISHYQTDGSWLAFQAERLVMDLSATDPQRVNSFWVSYGRKLTQGLTLNATVGLAALDNLNYQAGQSGRNYSGSIGLTSRF